MTNNLVKLAEECGARLGHPDNTDTPTTVRFDVDDLEAFAARLSAPTGEPEAWLLKIDGKPHSLNFFKGGVPPKEDGFGEWTWHPLKIAAPPPTEAAPVAPVGLTIEMIEAAIRRHRNALLAGRTSAEAMKKALSAALAASPATAPQASEKPSGAEAISLLKLIVDIAEGSTTANSLPNVAKIARQALASHAETAPQASEPSTWYSRAQKEDPGGNVRYWPSSFKAKHMLAEIEDLRAALAATQAPQASAGDALEFLSRDDQRLALWQAIESIRIGNKTDDKHPRCDAPSRLRCCSKEGCAGWEGRDAMKCDHIRQSTEGTSYCALAESQGQRWMPIETAPKDDTVLLSDGYSVGEGFWHDGSQCYGHRGGEGWFWESDRSELLIASNFIATHWMPLPLPPAPDREGA